VNRQNRQSSLGLRLASGAMAAWIAGTALALADGTAGSDIVESARIAPGPVIADGAAVPPADLTRDPALVRITSSFEVTHAQAVLRQVAKLFSQGFARRDAEQVAHLIDSLAAEQTRSWDFSGVRKGVAYPLRVRARIDAFGTLDLDFFAPPAVAGSVRTAVDGYLNARGL
jgi:hypothetical protein